MYYYKTNNHIIMTSVSEHLNINNTSSTDIKQSNNILNIDLKSVSDLQNILGDLKYEDLRLPLYKKYGLITKEEEDYPNLYMITYNKPNKYSKHSVNLTNEQTNILKQYRGIILEKNTNKPVCYTFDKMSRHFPDEWDLKDCKIMKSYDGSQIKLFYYDNKWVVSTTRRIDADKSYYFSNKSFMEMWKDASKQLDLNKLNTDCCYSFLMAHPDNRVVARHSNPIITHVLTRNMKTFKIVYDDIGIKRPELLTFKTKKDIWKSIKSLPYNKEGYVVNYNDTFIKIVNSKYQEVKDLRGSSNSLLCHYFVLKKEKNIKKFLSYYPETSEIFSTFEKYFNNLCIQVFNEYVLFRIRKVITDKDIQPFLKQSLYKVHGIHLKNKKRIKLNDVRKVLNNYDPPLLKSLIDNVNNLQYSYV